EALQEPMQGIERRRTSPDLRLAWRMPKNVNEGDRLDPLDRILAREQRAEDVAADIGRHAPEKSVDERIPAAQSKERFRPGAATCQGPSRIAAGKTPPRTSSGTSIV